MKALSNNQMQRATRPSETQEAIASIVRSQEQGVHLTALEVFQIAQLKGLDVSVSTVYRVLQRLRQVGDVKTVAGDHGLRYEAQEEDPEHDHDHLICLTCGITIEFFDDLIRGFGKTVAERKGFEHTNSRFDIYGHCSSCRQKDETRRFELLPDLIEETLAEIDQAVSLFETSLETCRLRKQEKTTDGLSAAFNCLERAVAHKEALAELLARRSSTSRGS